MTTTPIHTAAYEQTFDAADLSAKAHEHLWMHFTRLSSYAKSPVPTIVRGEGARIFDVNGKSYLDGLAGLFVVQAGHGRLELAEAAYKQASELAFFPIWSYAHPPAIELADRLADYAPGDLNKVFFTTGGGEAVETAWKLAKQYFKLTGKPMKHKVISRNIAYHGTPQGALSITGIPDAKKWFEPLVPGAHKVPNTNFYRAPEHGDDLEAFGRWAADQIDQAIEMEGPDTVACGLPRAGAELRRLLPAAARLLPAGARDLRQARRAARLRRGHLRVRPARHDVRLRQVRLRAGHDHLRQGDDQRLLPDRRVHRQRPDRRAVLDRRQLLPARLHLRRAPGVGRGRDGQPRHLRARGPQRARPGQRGRVPRHPGEAATTCRSSATSAATATSTASSWSRTRRPRRRSTTTSPSGCCAASCPGRCSRPACTAAPTTAATPSCSSHRR